MSAKAYAWKPIEDLPADWMALSEPDVHSLAQSWQETAEALRGTDTYRAFLEKLRRQWAIETGVLERLYSLSEGATKTLIEQGLDAAFISHDDTDSSPQSVLALIRDQHAAIEGLYQFISDERKLSKSYLRELHQALTAHQATFEAKDLLGNYCQREMVRGEWKSYPNNVELEDGSIFEFCPPEHVESELDRLILMHEAHVEAAVPPEVEAAWIHHRFSLIHPFVDGNGRVARCLATLILLKAQWFPLVVTRDDKVAYINALRDADRGDLSSLVGLFGRLQKLAVRQALSLSEEVGREVAAINSILESAKTKFAKRKKEALSQYQRAVDTADALFVEAKDRMEQLAKDVDLVVKEADISFRASVQAASRLDARAGFNKWQIIRAARSLGYFANLSLFPAWLELRIDGGVWTGILVSFHGLGHDWKGILVAVAMAYRKDQTEDGKHEVSELKVLSEEPFEITFKDDPIEIERRFRKWLEDRLILGLSYWQEVA